MNLSNKTFLPVQNYKNRNWFVIDCKGETLGRLATVVVGLLKGKVKPYYHPSLDIGDYIILINADLIVLNEKSVHYFVNCPGKPGTALKTRTASNCFTKIIIKKAVKGMLSETEAKRLLSRLNIYKGTNHTHTAQKPIELNISTFYSEGQLRIKTQNLQVKKAFTPF